MHATDGLSEAAKIAYQAFLDMSDSKQAHFDYMQALEAAYESGGAPSADEKRELADLLVSHDKNVLAFKTAMAAITDDDERASLFKLMS